MARKKRLWTPEIVRQRIRISMIVSRLTRHVKGELELSPTQITAAQTLLRKAMPDLSATEHSGEVRTKHVQELSDAELERIAARGIERIVETQVSPPKPDGLH